MVGAQCQLIQFFNFNRRCQMRIKMIMVCFILCFMSSWAIGQEVKLGALQDTTGATSDVGKDEALGVREAVQYFNDKGGVNGKKIRLFQYDYGYRVPEAITTYKRFRDYDKVVMVLGWGTGDTEALSPTINADKMPYLSSSFSGHLCDPKKTPYNFVYGTDYSTNARGAITYWFEEVWKKDPKWKELRDKGTKPKFVCFMDTASPYATAPIKAIKEQATILGFDIGPDANVSLTALDTKSQVIAAKGFGANLVWHGNTTMSVSAAMKDAYALGLGADHIVNNWGFDENLPKLAGPAAEGAMGLLGCALFIDEYPAKKTVLEYCKKLNPGVPLENRLIRTVQGWVKVGMAVEAMKRADKAGKLNGPGIKDAFETFKDWPGLKEYGGQLVTLTPTDHRYSSIVRVGRVIKGKPQTVAELDMRAKFPDRWAGWLGY
ncbi:MAG: branched-chain amino acid ABC transporter substrate-binding protein [Deltaproteobacteria bacterium]|nr:branched-chain amino acid ABC transporter substrate-binding protein [Deltaproteobacteria bacterium]